MTAATNKNKRIQEEATESQQSVADFYAGRSVFVTGASGFLGKVFIEKLLHDCPNVANIYTLLRTKGSSAAQTRLNELLESQAFDRIRKTQPKLFEKVKVIRGDVTFDNLGLSSQDLELLSKNVSIVVHSAATIRFDEPLKRAVRINVTATKRVLELALKLNNLAAFVHVSTAYCNEVKVNIEERVYKENISPSKLIELSDTLTDDMLESLSPHLFGDRPSSYHYTKAMAENLAKEYASKLPIGIVRPSIITAALKDPMPGWIDNYNGPSGYLVAAGKGILRTMLVDGKKICDAIPVDIVANTIINTAWYVNKFQKKCLNSTNNEESNKKPNPGCSTSAINKSDVEPFVVNCTTGQINPVTWQEIKTLSLPFLVKYPTHEMFRYPGPIFVSNKSLHKILILLEHDLPTYVIDLMFKSLGHNPMLGPIYQKVHRTSQALEYFTLNEWIYRNENFKLLNNNLSPEDKTRFHIDVDAINWKDYIEAYVIGIRHYLLKEDPKSISSAKFRLELLYYATQLTKASIAGVSVFCAFQILKKFRGVKNLKINK